jgi:hypothetical protein
MRVVKLVRRCALVGALLVATWSIPAQAQYTMVDLQALADQHGWAELIAHLGDIPPSRRDDNWKTLAQEAGIGSIQDAIKHEAPVDGLVVSEQLLTAFPGVKDSPEFMAKRADVGIKAFNLCFQFDKLVETCARLMRTFVAEDPDNHDLAFRAGLIARLNLLSWTAVPYFAMALQTGDPRCSNDQVDIAVLSGLALPPDDSDYHDALQGAKTIAGKLCWTALRAQLIKNLDDASSYYRDNTCPILRAHDALTEEQAKAACAAKN